MSEKEIIIYLAELLIKVLYSKEVEPGMRVNRTRIRCNYCQAYSNTNESIKHKDHCELIIINNV